jgi:hypothetical protein
VHLSNQNILTHPADITGIRLPTVSCTEWKIKGSCKTRFIYVFVILVAASCRLEDELLYEGFKFGLLGYDIIY